MCTHMYGICSTPEGERGMLIVLLCHLIPYYFEIGSLTGSGARLLTTHPRYLLSLSIPIPRSGFIGTSQKALLFMWTLEFEFWSSHLCSKPCYSMSLFSIP